MLKLGNFLIIIAVLFEVGSVIYFGSNFVPSSGLELLCEVGAVIVFILGVSIRNYHKRY